MRMFWGIAVGLVLVSPAIYCAALFTYPKASIGIMIENECSMEMANVSLDGLRLYSDYFDARILTGTFELSKPVDRENNEYLTASIIKSAHPEAIRRKYDVDLVLLIVSVPLKDSEGAVSEKCGKADTSTGSALVSVYEQTNLTDG